MSKCWDEFCVYEDYLRSSQSPSIRVKQWCPLSPPSHRTLHRQGSKPHHTWRQWGDQCIRHTHPHRFYVDDIISGLWISCRSKTSSQYPTWFLLWKRAHCKPRENYGLDLTHICTNSSISCIGFASWSSGFLCRYRVTFTSKWVLLSDPSTGSTHSRIDISGHVRNTMPLLIPKYGYSTQ